MNTKGVMVIWYGVKSAFKWWWFFSIIEYFFGDIYRRMDL